MVNNNNNQQQQLIDITWDIFIPIISNIISLCLGIAFGFFFLILDEYTLHYLPKPKWSGPEEITRIIKVLMIGGFIGIGLCCCYYGYYFGWISVVSIVVAQTKVQKGQQHYHHSLKPLNLKLERPINSSTKRSVATLVVNTHQKQEFHYSKYYSKEQVEHIFFDWLSTTHYYKNLFGEEEDEL
ncbi:hypothetical protein ABK040_007079 [Willaertia magna]